MKVIFFVLLYNHKTNEYKSIRSNVEYPQDEVRAKFMDWIDRKLKDNRDFILINMRMI